MHTRYFRIAVLLLITLGIALQAVAESPSDLLEKGIYTEQTVGDLEAAIAIYSQVVENTEAHRPHAAQALLRLGLCHLKNGNEVEGRAALDKLIHEFPEQRQLVDQAREQLSTARPALPLGPGQWTDGETLSYQISLPTGKVMGSLFLMADATVVDGVDAWKLETRRFIVNNADNYGVSYVLVDRQTQQPIRSSFRHGLLGNADATYTADGVDVRGDGKDTLVDSHPQIYDNEQMMHLVRTLPLEVGYEVTLPVLPIWTPEPVETVLSVNQVKSCEVLAGEYECFVLEMTHSTGSQEMWVSTSPERFPLKLVGGGVMFELKEIGRTDPDASVPFDMEQAFGFSGTLPSGWMFHAHRDRADRALIRLLDPEAAAISAIEVNRCPKDRCPALEEMAKRELSGAKRRFTDYTMRQDSWTERTIADSPAISFIGDYERNGKSWVQYRLYTFVQDVRLEIIFRTPKERFEDLQTVFDTIVDQLEAE